MFFPMPLTDVGEMDWSRVELIKGVKDINGEVGWACNE